MCLCVCLSVCLSLCLSVRAKSPKFEVARSRNLACRTSERRGIAWADWNFDFLPRCAAGARGLICFLLSLNLRGLKSHDHETWHVGPFSDLDVHGPSGILILGRVAPQAHAV